MSDLQTETELLSPQGFRIADAGAILKAAGNIGWPELKHFVGSRVGMETEDPTYSGPGKIAEFAAITYEMGYDLVNLPGLLVVNSGEFSGFASSLKNLLDKPGDHTGVHTFSTKNGNITVEIESPGVTLGKGEKITGILSDKFNEPFTVDDADSNTLEDVIGVHSIPALQLADIGTEERKILERLFGKAINGKEKHKELAAEVVTIVAKMKENLIGGETISTKFIAEEVMTAAAETFYTPNVRKPDFPAVMQLVEDINNIALFAEFGMFEKKAKEIELDYTQQRAYLGIGRASLVELANFVEKNSKYTELSETLREQIFFIDRQMDTINNGTEDNSTKEANKYKIKALFSNFLSFLERTNIPKDVLHGLSNGANTFESSSEEALSASATDIISKANFDRVPLKFLTGRHVSMMASFFQVFKGTNVQVASQMVKHFLTDPNLCKATLASPELRGIVVDSELTASPSVPVSLRVVEGGRIKVTLPDRQKLVLGDGTKIITNLDSLSHGGNSFYQILEKKIAGKWGDEPRVAKGAVFGVRGKQGDGNPHYCIGANHTEQLQSGIAYALAGDLHDLSDYGRIEIIQESYSVQTVADHDAWIKLNPYQN